MGTVGLSFGSPTSGAGFNVSSTVAEIVGNLQNVETPWKNQLTSLEGQNTAISNLCTLFSNLSNDVRSLTDFQGILAQKEGSSSDRGVLQLTENSNRNTESMLNAEIAKKQSYISTEQASLTAELNQANQIMQELPTELNGMNELDSAITGYNRNSNG